MPITQLIRMSYGTYPFEVFESRTPGSLYGYELIQFLKCFRKSLIISFAIANSYKDKEDMKISVSALTRLYVNRQ